MAIVTAVCKCFVNNALRNKGESFEYNGKENKNLQGVRKRAKKNVPSDEKNSEEYANYDSGGDNGGSDDSFGNSASGNVQLEGLEKP